MALGKSQIDRLGERLRKHEISEADLNMLREILTEHDGELESVVATLRTLRGRNGEPVAPTPRVKTTTTLIEKLMRDRTRLSSVRDIAGARIVVGETLDEQDEIVAAIMGQFPGSELIDRRADPRFGYRAVHVVVRSANCWAEIQIRTALQHQWAEVFERLADRVGRQIRYGSDPNAGPRFAAAQEAVQQMQDLSAQIAEIEDIRFGVRGLKRGNFDPRHYQQGVLSEDEMLEASRAYDDAMEVLQSMEERVVRLGEALASRLGAIRDIMVGS